MPEIPAGYVAIPKQDHDLYVRSFGLLGKLWDDKEVGADVRKGAKRIDENIRVPEIDVAEPLLAPIREQQAAIIEENKKLREELEADKTKRAEDQAVKDLQSSLEAAQRKHRLTEAGMSEVKKIMAERGVSDPEIAAQYVVANIEPVKPVSGSNFGPADLNVLGIDGKAEDESIKSLHSDPVKWLDSEVPKIMAEFEEEAA